MRADWMPRDKTRETKDAGRKATSKSSEKGQDRVKQGRKRDPKPALAFCPKASPRFSLAEFRLLVGFSTETRPWTRAQLTDGAVASNSTGNAAGSSCC